MSVDASLRLVEPVRRGDRGDDVDPDQIGVFGARDDDQPVP